MRSTAAVVASSFVRPPAGAQAAADRVLHLWGVGDGASQIDYHIESITTNTRRRTRSCTSWSTCAPPRRRSRSSTGCRASRARAQLRPRAHTTIAAHMPHAHSTLSDPVTHHPLGAVDQPQHRAPGRGDPRDRPPDTATAPAWASCASANASARSARKPPVSRRGRRRALLPPRRFHSQNGLDRLPVDAAD